MEPCWEFDPEDSAESRVEQAIKFLRRNAYSGPSSSEFHPGIWYSWVDPQQDSSTGIIRTESAHLEGFTAEEEAEIFRQITERK